MAFVTPCSIIHSTASYTCGITSFSRISISFLENLERTKFIEDSPDGSGPIPILILIKFLVPNSVITLVIPLCPASEPSGFQRGYS